MASGTSSIIPELRIIRTRAGGEQARDAAIAELGVSRPTIYRHQSKMTGSSPAA